MPKKKRREHPEPPTTTKKSKFATKTANAPESDVAEYLARFRNEHDGTNARGGGYQTKTDGAIMDGLRGALREGVPMPEACRCLKEFISAYGVSRTFPGVTEECTWHRLEPVVTHLRTADLHAGDAVDALADACNAAGFCRNVSFATKCLNMLGREVPIYSSEGKTPGIAPTAPCWLLPLHGCRFARRVQSLHGRQGVHAPHDGRVVRGLRGGVARRVR